MTGWIGKLGRALVHDHEARTFWTISRKKILSDRRWVFEDRFIRASKILPNVVHQRRYLSLLKSRIQQLQSDAKLKGLVGSVRIVDPGVACSFCFREWYPKLSQLFDLGAKGRRDRLRTQRESAPNGIEYLSALISFRHFPLESLIGYITVLKSAASRPNQILK